ncbi:hypothetical protein AAFF_G00238650 [Aldrovandia affinis]|uniref:Uncharacterized protein n=1 Tax=Aldrovandia affinis TaxID=143900 RepID=A0AAD7W3P4_9TELE|nr:hypothetical protein AAFF_G00238650 [Aldrovandia affinis]
MDPGKCSKRFHDQPQNQGTVECFQQPQQIWLPHPHKWPLPLDTPAKLLMAVGQCFVTWLMGGKAQQNGCQIGTSIASLTCIPLPAHSLMEAIAEENPQWWGLALHLDPEGTTHRFPLGLRLSGGKKNRRPICPGVPEP